MAFAVGMRQIERLFEIACVWFDPRCKMGVSRTSAVQLFTWSLYSSDYSTSTATHSILGEALEQGAAKGVVCVATVWRSD